MGRRGLTAGGVAAAAVLVALLLLQGGGSDADTGTTSSTGTLAGTETVPGGGTGSAGSQQQQSAIAEVLRAIDAGEQLPHEQDGGVFENREGRLPQMPRGYYREYTVPTPGSDDRGARRLVIGAEGEIFYTADHYDSFVRIDPEEYR